MFKWAASLSTKVASSLADTFAPLFRTPLEQLQDAWRKVEADCQSIMIDQATHGATDRGAKEGAGVAGGKADRDLDDPRLLAESGLVSHLNQLVEALVKEEQEQENRHGAAAAAAAAGKDKADHSDDLSLSLSPFDSLHGKGVDASKTATGPCFEYFLNEKILDRLCALGLPDRPMGMRQLVTKTLDAVLLHTKHPILPSMHVAQAVRQFMEVCYSKEDHKRRGYRSAFLSLLHTIARKIKEDSSIVGIFFDTYPPKQQRPPEFLLVTALCAMMTESSDGATAYEALLWIVQLPNVSVSEYVIEHTPFVPQTIQSLCNLFRALPPAADCPLLDELLKAPTQYPALDNFFRRWSYIDTLMRTSYEVMQSAVAYQLREAFLVPLIQPLLMDNREAVAIWTTNFIKHLCINSESQAMRQTIVEFLLGTDVTPERAPQQEDNDATAAAAAASSSSPSATSPPSPASSAAPSSLIRTTLLRRLDSLSDPLCMHTLDLFYTLIGLRSPLVIHNLILRNLQPIAAGADPTSPQSSVFAVTPVDILPIPQAIMFAAFHELPDFASLGAPFEEYLLDAQLEGQLWMQSWDDVYQRAMQRRADDMDKEAADAIHRATDTAAATAPAAASSSAAAAAVSVVVAPPFYEGLFLSTLLNKLECLFESSFETNLKLTGVLARLSYCPSPVLHHFLFQPDAHLGSNISGEPRHLLSVLSSVWNKGIKRASRMKDYPRRREEARLRLNAKLSPACVLASGGGSVETMDGERFLRGMILMEEFLKEMHAIGQAKARLFALQKLARLQGGHNQHAATTAATAAAAASRLDKTAAGDDLLSPDAGATPASVRDATATQSSWPANAAANAEELP